MFGVHRILLLFLPRAVCYELFSWLDHENTI
jgi:hypothetical protein